MFSWCKRVKLYSEIWFAKSQVSEKRKLKINDESKHELIYKKKMLTAIELEYSIYEWTSS